MCARGVRLSIEHVLLKSTGGELGAGKEETECVRLHMV